MNPDYDFDAYLLPDTDTLDAYLSSDEPVEEHSHDREDEWEDDWRGFSHKRVDQFIAR